MAKRKVRTHKFNGVRYEILIDEFNGWTDTDDTAQTLVVNRKPNSKKGLITIIHESLHAGNWEMDEETVDRNAKEIGSLLWRLGYRIKK